MSDASSLHQERDHPTPAFIESMRSRYVVEPQIDELLTRKMQRRAGPPYRRITMAELLEALTGLLDARLGPGAYTISDPGWFTGGVSKIQLGFTLRWRDGDRGERTERMVVRMEPSESSNSTSRVREAELLRLFEPVLPVPHVYWLDEDATWFPEPAMVYAYAPGVTRSSRATRGQVSGIGLDFGPDLRSALAPQFMQHLKAVHTQPIDLAALPHFTMPRVGTTDAARWLVDAARRMWEEDRGEDDPLMEVAAAWLVDNLPVLDVPSIVHGDYRNGNFLFDDDTWQITAWLDWERGHIGDRHRDLAWTTQRPFGHFDERGTRFFVSGLVPLDEFYDWYEEETGLAVDPARLDFYRILNCFQIIVSTRATAPRIVRLGKSHQDIVLSRVEGLTPIVAEEMRTLLLERI